MRRIATSSYHLIIAGKILNLTGRDIYKAVAEPMETIERVVSERDAQPRQMTA